MSENLKIFNCFMLQYSNFKPKIIISFLINLNFEITVVYLKL